MPVKIHKYKTRKGMIAHSSKSTALEQKKSVGGGEMRKVKRVGNDMKNK